MRFNVINLKHLFALGIGVALTSNATAQMRGGMGFRHPGLVHPPVGGHPLMHDPRLTGGMFGQMIRGQIHPDLLHNAQMMNGNPASHTVSPATSGQAFAQLSNEQGLTRAAERGFADGMADERRMDRLRNFYSDNAGYGTPSYLYGGGYGGGYGGTGGAIGTKYGAAITVANAGLLQDSIARQQAYFQGSFMNQDYELRRLQLQKARFDERAYEKANTPAPETVREELRMQRLARARNTPPTEEIASGDTLNELLTSIQRIQSRDVITGPDIALDPALLKHVNVTSTGDSRGSNELFKPGALVQWPSALKSEAYAADRKAIEGIFGEMADSNTKGTLSAASFDEARKIIEEMRDRLFASRFRLPFNDSADALSYLTKLEDAVNVLGRQNASGFVDGRFAATGNSVAKLVDHMLANGLQFARAKPGDESYYSGLYKSLATYEIGLSRKSEQQTALQNK